MVMNYDGKSFFDKINLSRCTEDIYLEVKELSENWKIEEYAKTKPGINNNVNVVKFISQTIFFKK